MRFSYSFLSLWERGQVFDAAVPVSHVIPGLWFVPWPGRHRKLPGYQLADSVDNKGSIGLLYKKYMLGNESWAVLLWSSLTALATVVLLLTAWCKFTALCFINIHCMVVLLKILLFGDAFLFCSKPFQERTAQEHMCNENEIVNF